MQRILITGGAGFFGVALARGLLDRNYSVRILDLEYMGDSDLKERVEFIKGDIRDQETLKKACRGIDYVFHNAAILPISRSQKKIFREINVGGTKRVLEESFNNQIKRVVFISSSAPYGIPKEYPITEQTAFNPVCDYGRSKIEAEKVCHEFRTKGLDVVILRPRTILGKGRVGLFQILFSWIADKKNIYLIGKGDNLFSLLSEKDLVAACILSIEKECRNEDFNLGTDKFKTVREDLQHLIHHVKSPSRIISVPANLAKLVLWILDKLNLVPFTPWHYRTPDKPFYFDISKAKNTLNWHPESSNFDMFVTSYNDYLLNRKEVDVNYGITHRKSVRQKILRLIKSLS